MKPSTKIHYDYSRLIVNHGATEEKRNLRQNLDIMEELITVFPEGGWEPMVGIYLVDYLVELADQITARRWKAIHSQRYGDYQGKIGRSLEEETLTVRGHLAAQVMLGLPLGKPDSKEEARIVGNIGGGHEAFIPLHNPLKHNLIVDPRTPDQIISWLVVPEGERTFTLKGWMNAEEAKQDLYLHERHREGGKSIAYWIPPEQLHDPKEWWETQGG